MAARQRFTKKDDPSDFSSEGKKKLSEEEAVEKASKGWIKKFALAFVTCMGVLAVYLFIIPGPMPARPMRSVPGPPEFKGPLAPNDILSNWEKIYVGQIIGPESVAVDGEHIYSGTADGWVVHAYKGEVQKLVRFGKGACGGIDEEPTCGRPLGVRFDKDGLLMVADAYYGLFKVNVVTGDYTTLYSTDTPVDGKKARLVNDMDYGNDGKIYFTDSTTEFGRNDFHMALFSGGGSGRLMVYDPATQKTSVLLENLSFPNGLQMTPDRSAVLFTLSFEARIMKYDLKTKKLSIWMEQMPGLPDNIRYEKVSGTYWVGLSFVRDSTTNLFDLFAPRPWLRALMMKILTVHMVEFLQDHAGTPKVQAMVLQVDKDGKIIRSLQLTSEDKTDSVSEVAVGDDALYMGSYKSPYIRKLRKKYLSGQ